VCPKTPGASEVIGRNIKKVCWLMMADIERRKIELSLRQHRSYAGRVDFA
jgi:hypothetical protein